MTLKSIILENARLKAALVGKTKKGKSIQSFGIISPENPMGNKLTSKENMKHIERMKKQLSDGKHSYTRTQGMYEQNKEKSFFIYNINLSSMMSLGKTYGQKSFIFGENSDKGMTFYFYEKGAGNSQYAKKYTKTEIKNQSDADDFFSRNKSYRFNIPFFEAFEEAKEELNEKFDYIDDDIYNEAIKYNLEKSKTMTGKHLWIKRCELFMRNK